MPPATPKKLVHWDTNSPSLDSPLLNATIDSSTDSTSSFEFINSQLVAHGYLASPGLTLAGISNDESNRLAKCLLSMLSQRADDMSRTEQLTIKLRTLNYDHERLSSMHRVANEKAANAEREMNMHKSKQAAALKNLDAEEVFHRQTSLELQRTRNLLQGVRATHAAELKKKEKEIERILEKWQKLAETQTKVAAASVGFRCSNATVIDGAVTIGKGQGFLDIALEQAEQARAHLSDESLLLRKLLLRAINELQDIIYQMKSISNEEQAVEPVPTTMASLFPIAPSDLASDVLRTVLKDLRHSLTLLSRQVTLTMAPSNATNPQMSEEEVKRLNITISNLKEELASSRKQSLTHMAETQAMFDKFAEEHRIATSELVPASLMDEEKENLKKELDIERQKFSDAAIKLAKEKAALEAERVRFLDDKRTWQAEQMLVELPRNPAPTLPLQSSLSSPNLPSRKSPRKSPHKGGHRVTHTSPHKSPVKSICVGKAGGSGRNAHRVSRRSLITSPSRPAVSYETEYMPPPLPAPSFTFTTPAPPSLVPSTSGSLLPTTFVLPPPSPRASLPTNPALPERLDDPPSPPSTETTEIISPSHTPEVSPPPITKNPKTPPAVQRGFAIAKPFAMRMMHAYSPAKPSPLSRILLLGDSPLTPDALNHDTSLSPISAPLAAVAEEEDDGLAYITKVLNYNSIPPAKDARMSATELGLDSPPETPLQEMKIVSANIAPSPEPLLPIFGGRGKVFFADPEADLKMAADKGKARAVEHPRTRTGAGEKENITKSAMFARARLSKVPPAKAASGSGRATAAAGSAAKPLSRASIKSAAPVPLPASTTNITTRVRPSSRPALAPSAGAGPRRVLVTSADAPPILKGRRI